jgi:3-methyl-2-oxobutanoate hydroxymethyltransferase
MTNALREYHEEVKARKFPAPQNTYPIDPLQLEKFFIQERERNGMKDEENRTVHVSML